MHLVLSAPDRQAGKKNAAPFRNLPKVFFLNSKHEEILSKIGVLFEKNIEDFKKLEKICIFPI